MIKAVQIKIKQCLKLLIGLCMLFLMTQLLPRTIMAKSEVQVNIEGGELKFTTRDTKASSTITWRTVGFSVTRNKCLSGSDKNGGFPTDMKNGSFFLEPQWKFELVNKDTVYVQFTIPEAVVNKALVQAGLDGIKENDVFYLHGIHQVLHNGNPYGGYKYSLLSHSGKADGIADAENWYDARDFNDRFDIEVKYHSSGLQPIRVTYLTADNKVISSKELPKKDWVDAGGMAQVTHSKSINYEGKTLYLAKSYQCYLATGKRISGTTNAVTGVNAENYEQQLPTVQIRKKKQSPGGLEFVAVMREQKQKEDSGGDGMEENLENPLPYGIIAADDRDGEKFDVEDGIPTTEDMYVNVFSSDYLLGYRFRRIKGEKQYRINVKKNYILQWHEETEDKKKGKIITPRSMSCPVTKSFTISRSYSYWQIEKIEYYRIEKANINNAALPGGTVVLIPNQYRIPELSYTASALLSSHLREPEPQGLVDLGTQTVNGGNSRPEVPSENFQSVAEAKTDKIKVKNDFMAFDGKTVMISDWEQQTAKTPSYVESASEETGRDVLYRSGLSIGKEKANGIFSSSGNITYTCVKKYNSSRSDSLVFSITGLNNVVVHTPAVCDASVSDVTSFNQMINPDRMKAGLVLDQYFTLSLPTAGNHRYINGYGYRDYAKYQMGREARFPFDVYCKERFYKAGTWIAITEDYTRFYLPYWVDEGCYTFECRAPAVNIPAMGEGLAERLANLQLSNYIAVDTVDVQVSGRLYGLSLYDISDYPIWEPVFRWKDSLKTTGFQYMVGTNDQNGAATGRSLNQTLPLVKGSHPAFPNVGTVGLGYATRFHVTTVGNMDGDQDYIKIKPRFYFVREDGSGRQEADVYYSETILGKKNILIRAGGEMDLKNIKSSRTGDPYLGIPEEELLLKASLEKQTPEWVWNNSSSLFTYTNIMIPGGMRTYTGLMYDKQGEIPLGVDKIRAAKARQKWYCEYYLPSELYAVPKNFDLKAYSRSNRIDLHEPFWLRDGYLVVNFDIETIQNGTRHLSYINRGNSPAGYCSMWRLEGFPYSKTDSMGSSFDFIDGDYILYDLRHSASEDYKSGGTH